MEINKEILRWVILIGAIPIWLPFLVTLWRDFNDALKEDGGLLGSPPTGRDLEVLRKELAEKPEVLISEPIVRAGDRRQPRMAAPGRGSAGANRAGGKGAAAKRAEPRFRG